MAWIESHQELANHPKVLRLARLLDVSRQAAIGYLHLLWWWALAYADDGDLSRYDHGEISAAVGWPDDPQLLIDALTEAGWLESDMCLHDWWEYAGKLVERRQKDRVRKAEARKKSTGRPADGPPDVLRSGVRTQPNPTVPNRTQPEEGDKSPRKRDELWDIFIQIHGEPASKSERGKFNKIVAQLREANVTPVEYPGLVAAYVSKYGGSQPAAATVANRVGEMRNYAAKGPMQAPDADRLRQDMEWAAVLEAHEQEALP